MDGWGTLSSASVQVITKCGGIIAPKKQSKRGNRSAGWLAAMETEASGESVSAGGVAAMETEASGESVRYVKVRAPSRRGTLQRPSREYSTDPGYLLEGAYGVPDLKDGAVQAAWEESGTYATFGWGQLQMFGDGCETGAPFDAEVEATMYAEYKRSRKARRKQFKVEAVCNDAVAKREIKEEEAADKDAAARHKIKQEAADNIAVPKSPEADKGKNGKDEADCDSDSDKSDVAGGNGGENDDDGAKSDVAGGKRDGTAGKLRGPPIELLADQTLPKGFGTGYIDKAPHGCEFTVDAHASQEGPLDSLFRIFGKELFKDIAVNTSKNQARWAALDKDRVARPVSFDEIIHWFGLVVAMGLQKIAPSRRYWSSSLAFAGGIMTMPNFNQVMSCNRFEEIKRFLRYVDTETLPKSVLHADAACKVRGIIQHMQAALQRISKPASTAVIDESIWPTNVRTKLRHNMKICKPDGIGFKVWVLCSPNGMPHGFILSDKQEKKWLEKHLPQCSAMQAVVIRLVEACGLSEGSRLMLDRAFTSLRLFRYCNSRGVYATGPIARASVGFPAKKVGAKRNKESRQMWGTDATWEETSTVFQKKRAVRGWQKQLLSKDGVFQATSWKDTGDKPMYLLSTQMRPGRDSYVARTDRGGRILKVPAPHPAAFYNIEMNGVDVLDHLASGRLANNFCKQFRTKRCTPKLILHLFAFAQTSTWIMYRDLRWQEGQQKKGKKHDFVNELVGAMIGFQASSYTPTESRTPSRHRTTGNTANHQLVMLPRHKQRPNTPNVGVCYFASNTKCRGGRTSFACAECKVCVHPTCAHLLHGHSSNPKAVAPKQPSRKFAAYVSSAHGATWLRACRGAKSSPAATRVSPVSSSLPGTPPSLSPVLSSMSVSMSSPSTSSSSSSSSSQSETSSSLTPLSSSASELGLIYRNRGGGDDDSSDFSMSEEDYNVEGSDEEGDEEDGIFYRGRGRGRRRAAASDDNDSDVSTEEEDRPEDGVERGGFDFGNL
jgi:hypothetical protein